MTPTEILGLIVGILALTGAAELRVKALVKYYLSELKPNGGQSMKDQLNRLEIKVETLVEVLKSK
jgi:hypothetical protein